VIGDDDAGEYFLSGAFTVDPAGDSTPPVRGTFGAERSSCLLFES
jgi:hypothetical protein